MTSGKYRMGIIIITNDTRKNRRKLKKELKEFKNQIESFYDTSVGIVYETRLDC